MTIIEAPAALTTWLQANSRTKAVHDHRVEVNLDWWNDKLATFGHEVSGTLTNGSATSNGRAFISRADLFEMAPAAETGDPVPFLWHVAAWGSGLRNRNNGARIKAVYEDPNQAAATLHNAFRAASKSPYDAFLSMRGPRNSNAIKFLGPAFFTKVLYFAGAGTSDHPSLIVDNRVLATLHAATDEKHYRRRFGYPVATYQAAVEQMQEWARQESAKLNREVAADEIERWAFRVNGTLG